MAKSLRVHSEKMLGNSILVQRVARRSVLGKECCSHRRPCEP